MKLVFLNVWDGEIREGIETFVKEHSVDTDIFCFQEAYDKMKHLCEQLLPSYTVISEYKYVSKQDDFAQATYIRESLEIERIELLLKDTPNTGLGIYTQVGAPRVHTLESHPAPRRSENLAEAKERLSIHPALPGGVSRRRIKDEDYTLCVCNFHGISKPGKKLDTSERLLQSAEILNFFKDIEGPKIIGGDFNLELDSNSVKMFEENGYKNLIRDRGILTTRNRLTWEKYPEGKQYFSDYVFVSSDVKVKDFLVENIEISDHLPMILSIET